MVLAGLFGMVVLPALPAILAPNRRESCSPNLRWRRLHCRWRCRVCGGVCRWEGMVCSSSGQVVSLSLSSYGLTSTLSTAIGDLTFLRMLNLSSNWFHGEVPATIVRLAHLQALDLSYNAFTELNSRDAIPEAMEQQTISIAKAAITIVLILGTSFLAAANPITGCYDALKKSDKSFVQQAEVILVDGKLTEAKANQLAKVGELPCSGFCLSSAEGEMTCCMT
ncbi:hypothetical protein ZEAMMB73_Zm00001d003267 [Zea mays]|uniref:MCM C-terminal AAA(+) ATPase domain-containing protein n=1 Tax=Zea mays TaxID=4577 RepID=A0A1D6E845_MAIZE|nr:hypothetical protein ZEAMMB73_Zm00001d003267 [Zea mays]